MHFIREVKVPPNFVAIEDIVDEPYIGYVMETGSITLSGTGKDLAENPVVKEAYLGKARQ